MRSISSQAKALVLRTEVLSWVLMRKKKPVISNTDLFFCFNSTVSYILISNRIILPQDETKWNDLLVYGKCHDHCKTYFNCSLRESNILSIINIADHSNTLLPSWLIACSSVLVVTIAKILIMHLVLNYNQSTQLPKQKHDFINIYWPVW
jgi:hypothetical protein